jgi:serine/threonine protein kinase
MDHLSGRTLEDHVNDAAGTPVSDRIVFLTGIATALDALHRGAGAGGVVLVHGDVKPSNIVINEDGAPVLVDVEGLRTPQNTPLAAVSLPYAAPELPATGYRPSPESDRFAFYATVVHVLLGEVPPVRDGTLDIDAALHRLQADPALATRHALLGQVEQALRAAPEDRPASLARWLNHLRASWSQSTIPPVGGPSNPPGSGPPNPPSGEHRRFRWARRSRASANSSPRLSAKTRLAAASLLIAVVAVGAANALADQTDTDGTSGNLADTGDLGAVIGETRSPTTPATTAPTSPGKASRTAAAPPGVGAAPISSHSTVATSASHKKASPTKIATTPAKPAEIPPLRRLGGTPESGSDHCGWWVTAKAATLKYRGCVHHSVNGWYGGLQITNTGSTGVLPNLYITDWTVLPDGSDSQQMSPGKWNGTMNISAGETIYVVGGVNHPPTDRCTAVQGRPINTGAIESWASTPFIRASGDHCAPPENWSAPK